MFICPPLPPPLPPEKNVYIKEKFRKIVFLKKLKFLWLSLVFDVLRDF